MSCNKDLHTVALQFKEQVDNGWDVFRIDVCFWLIPKKYGTVFQRTIFRKLPDKRNFANAFSNKIKLKF